MDISCHRCNCKWSVNHCFGPGFLPVVLFRADNRCFVTVYLLKDEHESGLIHGALAGVLGGLLIGILSLFGVGAIAVILGILLAQLGLAVGAIGVVIVIFLTILAMLVCGVLSAIGGAIGEYVQSAGHRNYYEYEDY